MANQDTEKLIKKAHDKALATLRERYADIGIHAGKHHFSDVWIRDCCFAGLGSIWVGDMDIVKTSLITMFSNLSPEGQVPLRVGQKHFLLKYLFRMNGTPKPRYIEDKGVSISVDNNPLSILLAATYIRESKDIEFANTWYPTMKKIIDWQFKQDENNDSLIEEGYYAGWADSLKKNGNVLYTNVLHYKSLVDMSTTAEAMGNHADALMYGDLSESVKHAIFNRFWNGSFFTDWIDNTKHDYFSTDGNMLAIIFGLASKAQGHSIMDYVHTHNMNQQEGVMTNWPLYRHKHVYPLFRLINMADYHNGMVWLWLGGIYAIALHEMELDDEAKDVILNISKQIIKDDDVYEVYENGKPVRRLFYKSEDGFAWTSGIFVWACQRLGLVKT